jgi:transcriptional regulator with XRE-family HTH domain
MLPEQCRAARAWLNWTQRLLAAKAGVSASTIRNFEAGNNIPHPNNLAAIRRALEEGGMQIADDGSTVGKKKGRSWDRP